MHPRIAFVVMLMAAATTLPLTLSVFLPTSAVALDDTAHYKGWDISSFELEGMPAGVSDPTSGLILSGRRRWVRREYPKFFPSRLEEDSARLRLYLARRGYPYAGVEPRIESTPEKRSLAVTLHVFPGPAVRVNELSVEGLPAGWTWNEETPLPLATGDVFDEARLDDAAQILLQSLRGRGHAKARVEGTPRMQDSVGVSVYLNVTPGPIFYFRRTRARGAPDDLLALSEEVFDLPAGDRYAPRHVDRGRENLILLGLFRQIKVYTEEVSPESLDVRLDLVERSPRTLRFGVGRARAVST